MPVPLLFAMTAEAADYIRSRLGTPAAGRELALITVLRQGEMVNREERIRFDGEHFLVCTYNIGQRPHAQHIELFGHRVSIEPSTLESLRGRTLKVRRVVEPTHGFGEPINVLVAA